MHARKENRGNEWKVTRNVKFEPRLSFTFTRGLSYLRLFHLRMEILRALNQPLVWGNDGGRKDFIYLDFVSVICKE